MRATRSRDEVVDRDRAAEVAQQSFGAKRVGCLLVDEKDSRVGNAVAAGQVLGSQLRVRPGRDECCRDVWKFNERRPPRLEEDDAMSIRITGGSLQFGIVGQD